MPFTFAHPAAVIPLTLLPRRRISITALVLGSTIPDFEYFLNFAQESQYSHTWLGVLWYDLPLGLILLFLFNRFIRNPLIDNLPLFLNRRFSRYRNSDGNALVKRHFIVIVYSLLTGIVSHLVWDKLTHRSVRLVDDGWAFYSLIWNINSLIGFAIIMFAVLKMPKRVSTQHRKIYLYWLLLLNFVVMAYAAILLGFLYQYISYDGMRNLGVSLITACIIGLISASVCYSLVSKARKRRSLAVV